MNGKSNGQVATIVVILSMLALAIAYIFASVVDTTGQVKDTVGVIMVVLAALGLYLQQAQTTRKVEVIHERTEKVVEKVDKVENKLDTVGHAVDGINAAALANQKIVSEAAGFNRGVAETAQVASAAQPAPDPISGDVKLVAPVSVTVTAPKKPPKK